MKEETNLSPKTKWVLLKTLIFRVIMFSHLEMSFKDKVGFISRTPTNKRFFWGAIGWKIAGRSAGFTKRVVYVPLKRSFSRLIEALSEVFFKHNYQVISVVVILILLGNVWLQISRLPSSALGEEYFKLNSYPLSPFVRANVVQSYMNLGYQTEAKQFLEASEVELKTIPRQIKDLAFNPVEKVVFAREIKEKHLENVLGALDSAPYSESLLLSKAELEAELLADEDLYKTLSVVSWLDPKFLPESWLKLQ